MDLQDASASNPGLSAEPRHSDSGPEPGTPEPTLDELKSQVALLRRELADARRESDLRAELLARASHEIRNPVNAIWGLAQDLLEASATAREREGLHGIASASGTLLALVNQLLDYGALRQGGLSLDRKPFGIRDCLEDALDIVAMSARAKGLDLDGGVHEAVPEMLLGDGVKVRQVLLNLLQNAVKFTAFGAVSAAVAAQPVGPGRSEVLIEVSDTGMGLSRQARERLFSPYGRGASQGVEGTGLGLWICKQIVEFQGGRIGVESRPRKGSRFWVRLPFDHPPGASGERPLEGRRLAVLDPREVSRQALCHALRAAGATALPLAGGPELAALTAWGRPPSLLIVGLGEKELELESYRETLGSYAAQAACPLLVLAPRLPAPLTACVGAIENALLERKPLRRARLLEHIQALLAPACSPASAPAAPTPPLGWKALVIEDTAVNQLWLTRLLASRGVESRVAGSGEAALGLAAESRFDLVLTDAHLPGMDGAQTVRALRAGKQNAGVPILAITADVTPETRAALREAGVDACLEKPLDPALFWRTAEALVGAAAGSAVDERVPVIDRVEALARVGGEPQAARELLDALVASLPGECAALEAALAAGDLERVANAAHALVGGAIYCGATQLRQAAERLQEAARAGARDALPGLGEELRRAVAGLLAEAQREVGGET